MKKALALSLFFILPLAAQTAKPAETKETPEQTPNKALAAKALNPSSSSFMMIDASTRATDYKEAFDMLKKDKTANKIAFQLTNGDTITNISDITLSTNGTLLIVKFTTVQGNRFQVIPVENIASLSYLP